MNIEVSRYSINIFPQNEQDVAYLEEVLGLRKSGDIAAAVRIDIIGGSTIAYVKVTKNP